MMMVGYQLRTAAITVTELPKIIEGINAGIVPVTPDELQAIATHRLHTGQVIAGLIAKGLALRHMKPPQKIRLSLAIRTRAVIPQHGKGQQGLMSVFPADSKVFTESLIRGWRCSFHVSEISHHTGKTQPPEKFLAPLARPHYFDH